jgi:uncharacterized protein YdaU (DUF1376 family)
MAKDPAFLFYYQDFLVGTDDMTNEEIGAYIRCLCFQAAKGSLSEKHMMKICYSSDVHNAIKKKFTPQSDGTFLNERLQIEIEKRIAFSNSRRQNRVNKGKTKKSEKENQNHMKNISSSYDQHMENENENENENEIKNKNDEIENFEICHHPFVDEIKKNYPEISKMQKPLTDEQAEFLEINFDRKQIFETFDAMENHKNLVKKYRSTFLTVKSWMKIQNQKNGKPNYQNSIANWGN